jgi:hypothetical protein
MPSPIITVLTDNNPRTGNRMSAEEGYNQTIVTIAFDQPIDKYSVNRGGTDHLTGTVLESGDVSYSAEESFTISVEYTELINGDNTIYFYGRNSAGEWSDGLNDVPPPTKPSWRYIKFEGWGAVVPPESGTQTTRGIELQVWSGGQNRVLNQPILSTEAQSTGIGTPAMLINGTITTGSGTYPIWWTTLPNGRVVIDMGTIYPIDEIVYCTFPDRIYAFKILGSNTNNGTDWTDIWDMSGNTTETAPALPNGYRTTFT